MKTFLLLLLYFKTICALNRQRRSCSTDLQTAFASLTNHQQVIISVPEEEQQLLVHRLPNIYNQACNQKSFYENLQHKTFINKKRHNPTFLLKPTYQSPEEDALVFSNETETYKVPQYFHNKMNPLKLYCISL